MPPAIRYYGSGGGASEEVAAHPLLPFHHLRCLGEALQPGPGCRGRGILCGRGASTVEIQQNETVRRLIETGLINRYR